MQAKDYRAVFSTARFKASCRYFLVLAIPNEIARARLGVVVSKKNVPGAVQRNRLKRLLRENFRIRQAKLSGVDIVVLARKNAHTLGNNAISNKIDGLWNVLTGKMQNSVAMNTQDFPGS